MAFPIHSTSSCPTSQFPLLPVLLSSRKHMSDPIEIQPTKRPSSPRRVAASRENGKLSNGPITEEGKAAAARANFRHGILSNSALLESENAELFQALLAQYVECYSPADGRELTLLDDAANAYWRVRRVRALETRAMDNAVALQTSGDDLDRILGAFKQIAGEGLLNLLNRYETRFYRIQRQSLRDLKDRKQTAASLESARAI